MGSFHRSNSLSEISPYAASSTASQPSDDGSDFVQNALFALTGIEGKYLKKDVITGGLKLDAKVRISTKHSAILLRIGEAAFYHEQLISFTDPSTGRSPLGLLGQGNWEKCTDTFHSEMQNFHLYFGILLYSVKVW